MTRRLHILVVDDEPQIRSSVGGFLTDLGHRVTTCASAEEALDQDAGAEADVALLDIRMPGMDGLSLLAEATERWNHLAVIVISGHGTMDAAIQALRLGAVDFLRKPFALTDLEAALARCGPLGGWRKERSAAPRRSGPHDELIGPSRHLAEVREQLELAAGAGLRTLLIEGETGTGKEVVARTWHRLRTGGGGPFVAVNCPALPESLVESELFGHAKGAFTGATEAREGAFQRADGGVLLLDEVADLHANAQAKLLRALETWQVTPVGSGRAVKVECSVVSACNRRADELVANGRLRADLYYRLNAFTVVLLPLRERLDDVLPLARHFLTIFANETGQTPATLTATAERALLAHHWPGNIRELRTLVQRAAVFAGRGPIDVGHLRFSPHSTAPHSTAPHSTAPLAAPMAQPPTPAAAPLTDERETTRLALVHCGWNRARAARELGISYETMRWRIAKWELLPQ